MPLISADSRKFSLHLCSAFLVSLAELDGFLNKNCLTVSQQIPIKASTLCSKPLWFSFTVAVVPYSGVRLNVPWPCLTYCNPLRFSWAVVLQSIIIKCTHIDQFPIRTCHSQMISQAQAMTYHDWRNLNITRNLPSFTSQASKIRVGQLKNNNHSALRLTGAIEIDL